MTERTHQQLAHSRSESRSAGKALRRQVPRRSHGDWAPAPDRPDPLSLLQAPDEGRLEHLLPIKYGRMVASPFACLRGSATVMAADLAATPTTGIEAVLCGDAHLSNFGVFATPERQLVFDINDFDETFPGPWEWDLKRLAISAVVAGRENGFSEKVCRRMAVTIVETYRTAMERFAQMHALDVWYYHVDTDAVLSVFEAASSRRAEKRAQKLMKKARSKTHQQTLEKLTRVETGRRRIISDPPLLVPLRGMALERILSEEELRLMTEEAIESTWTQYLDSLPDERRYLLQQFRLVDAALRVGGVGSVGTRCTIALLEGGAGDDHLLLQLKEAGPSVLEQYLDRRGSLGHGERVVTGQRLMQAASDMFLGWHSSPLGERDYYWRQLKDMKGSADVADMDEDGFNTYVSLCSWCLARAHARTGEEASIGGYIGKNDAFAEAIADFAVAYADQTERDHGALVEAIRSGRIAAETGI
jgi:uncharacterized protein (DUF2252 family)